RETAKGTYYSIVSEQEKLEFKLGQHKEGDTLYAKGWEPLFQKEGEKSQGAPAPAFGNQQQAAAPAQQAAPSFGGFGLPHTHSQTPAPSAPAPAFGAGQMPVPQTVASPAAAPAAATSAAAPAAPAQSNPQVQAVANNVLARFG